MQRIHKADICTHLRLGLVRINPLHSLINLQLQVLIVAHLDLEESGARLLSCSFWASKQPKKMRRTHPQWGSNHLCTRFFCSSVATWKYSQCLMLRPWPRKVKSMPAKMSSESEEAFSKVTPTRWVGAFSRVPFAGCFQGTPKGKHQVGM